MACYLVTGVAGFIASRTAELLLAAGHQVVGVDNLNDYYDVRLKDWRLSRLLGRTYALGGSDSKVSTFAGCREPVVHGRFEYRTLDTENFAALEAVFRAHQFDAVLNLAARAGVRYSMENPFVYLSSNTAGTLNILELMRRHGVVKHILASTSSLYAGQPMPFTEDQPVNAPISPYAATKKAAELLAYTYHHLYKIDSSIVRYFTVYGPAGRPDMSPFRFIKWIDEGTPLQLFGDGTQSRDFTYVDDIARGTIAALRPVGYEIINLGGGKQPVTMNDFISRIEQRLGKKAVIDRKPFHAADVKDTSADITKARKLLGWEPEVSLDDGLRLTVDWYQANRSWVASIAV